MRVQPANAHDAARLAVFLDRTFRDAFAAANTVEDMQMHCTTRFTEAVQARELADPSLQTFLIEHEGELIACVQLRRDSDKTDELEIQRVYVDSAWHGAGVAPMLIAQALEVAEQHGAVRVWLGVWEHNPRAIAFYRKHGFVESGEQTFLLGTDLQRDLVMSRTVRA